MAAKTNVETYQGYLDFIKAHSEYNGDTGARSMTRADHYKLAETQAGLTHAILDDVSAFDENKTSAAVRITADDLATRVAAAREAGDETGDMVNTLRIATPGGSTEIKVRAERQRTNPKTREAVTVHGSVDVKISAKKRIAQDALDYSKDVVTKALGIKS